MEYKIVMAESITSLTANVNKKIAEGWEPTGGVCYSVKAERYLQSLIKRNHE